MKTNAIVRIVLFSLAILVLVGILFGALSFNMFRFDSSAMNEQAEEFNVHLDQIRTEYATEDIRNIKIDWVDGNITICKDAAVSEITVTEKSAEDSDHRMRVVQSGNTLKIEYSDSGVHIFGFGNHTFVRKDLEITVPADWDCALLEIDTASAEIVIEDLTIDEFDFDGASGVCKINNCNVGGMDIDTASGGIYFSGTLETLDCDAASADCSIEVSNIPRSIKMDGMSGDLELILPPDAGFTCTMDTMSGDFESDFEFKSRNDTYICGDGDCKIEVSGMSGAVSILKGIA